MRSWLCRHCNSDLWRCRERKTSYLIESTANSNVGSKRWNTTVRRASAIMWLIGIKKYGAGGIWFLTLRLCILLSSQLAAT